MNVTREQFKELAVDLVTLEGKARDVVDDDTLFAIKTCFRHASEAVNIEDVKITKAIINAIYSLLKYVHQKTEQKHTMREVNEEVSFILLTLESYNLGPVICW